MCMQGIWFTMLVAGFIAVGVVAQVGWTPGPIPVAKLTSLWDRRNRRRAVNEAQN
jgi:hypothetical protein